MQSISVLSIGNGKIEDLANMDLSEASKNLYGQVQWEDVSRSGVFLEHRQVNYQTKYYIMLLISHTDIIRFVSCILIYFL